MDVIADTNVPRHIAAYVDFRCRSAVHAGIARRGGVRVAERQIPISVGPVKGRVEAILRQGAAESAARAGVVGVARVLDVRTTGQRLEIEFVEYGARGGQTKCTEAFGRYQVVSRDRERVLGQRSEIAELIDHIQPIRLIRVAFAGRRAGEKRE